MSGFILNDGDIIKHLHKCFSAVVALLFSGWSKDIATFLCKFIFVRQIESCSERGGQLHISNAKS